MLVKEVGYYGGRLFTCGNERTDSLLLCLFTYSRVAGDPRNQCCANRVIVAIISLFVRVRPFNLVKGSYDPALGRVLAWEARPPCSTASAHSGYLVGLSTSQTVFQHIFVSNTTLYCKIYRTLCKTNHVTTTKCEIKILMGLNMFRIGLSHTRCVVFHLGCRRPMKTTELWHASRVSRGSHTHSEMWNYN